MDPILLFMTAIALSGLLVVLERNGMFYNRCFPWCLLPRDVCPSSCFFASIAFSLCLHILVFIFSFPSFLVLCLSLPPHFFHIGSFYLNRFILFDSLWHGGSVETVFGGLRMREGEKDMSNTMFSSLAYMQVCFHCRLQDSMLNLLLF